MPYWRDDHAASRVFAIAAGLCYAFSTVAAVMGLPGLVILSVYGLALILTVASLACAAVEDERDE